jgi:CheY-like chemotaxis protein
MSKIIILDDDKFLSHMYEAKFKNLGQETAVFESGEELTKYLKEGGAADLLLLDIIIPGLSGLDTLEAIRKENLAPKAKVIMLTNESDSTEKEKAKSLGAVDFIVKATATPSEVVSQAMGILTQK